MTKPKREKTFEEYTVMLIEKYFNCEIKNISDRQFLEVFNSFQSIQKRIMSEKDIHGFIQIKGRSHG